MDHPPPTQILSAQDAVARFADVTVLVVGDFMLDRFVYGDLERISPEAPIPILRGRNEQRMLGGGGNVVANIASLGGRALPLTVIGDDLSGSEIAAMMADLNVATDGLLVSDARCTSQKSRFIAQKQQVLRFDEEDRSALARDERDRLLDLLPTMLSEADIAILSDYGKGVLMDGVAADIIAACRERRLPVLVDPKGPDYAIYAGATAVTPNRSELSEASGHGVADEAAIEAAARHLVAAHGFDFLLATRSEDGLSVISADSAHHIATAAQEVFDVSGAGDTVIASFALALAAGLDTARAGSVANVAAGIAVAKRGTAQVTRSEMLSWLNGSADEHGPLQRDEALRLVAEWKDRGFRVGFTNGCFDILHAGHISLLREARHHCDRLVVGLNTDSSVRRLKGADRPVNNENDRAAVLAALKTVDAVVPFDEDTPAELIAALVPDVLVKGADYTIEQVVGADTVIANNGRVVLADLVPGKSTTQTIRSLRAADGHE